MDGGSDPDADPAVPLARPAALQHPGQLAQLAGAEPVQRRLPQLLAHPERENSGFHHQEPDGGHQVARVPGRGCSRVFVF